MKTVIVTGGARGIGAGIVRHFYDAGWNVSVVDLINKDASELTDLADNRVFFIKADITKTEERSKIIELNDQKFHRLDCLVNNAGIAPPVRLDILDAQEDSFDKVLSVNLKGPYFLTQIAAKYMIESKKKEIFNFKPSIINIGSISAYTSSVSRGEYCISKAGVSMMTMLYADRLADEGIMVYEIRPGIIKTPMTSGVKDKYDNLIAEGLLPIHRWGLPEDIGNAAISLASGAIPYSTGQVIDIDGGFHIRRL
jgi:NAD(P)-dependent dehydrogenase (short-subunit alcohol dehydrogenase family)